MKKIVYSILLLMLGSAMQAQDSLRSQKSISMDYGFTSIINKDLYRSPYVYKGFNPCVRLTGERVSTKSLQKISVGIIFGTIKTSFSPLASTQMINADYSYMRKIISNKKITIHIGPQISLVSWNANYFPEMQVPSYSKVRSYMLGASVGGALQLNYILSPKSSLKINISAPLLSYGNRPQFLDGSAPESRVSLAGLWNPQINLMYEYNISSKVSLFLSYRYQYLQYAYPKEIRMLGNSWSMGVKFKFR